VARKQADDSEANGGEASATSNSFISRAGPGFLGDTIAPVERAACSNLVGMEATGDMAAAHAREVSEDKDGGADDERQRGWHLRQQSRRAARHLQTGLGAGVQPTLQGQMSVPIASLCYEWTSEYACEFQDFG